MKFYIAGKIGGLSEDEVEANFAKARKEVAAQGFEVVCPRCLAHNHDRSWLSFMREDLKALVDCDGIYAQDNWQDSKGATIEVNLAKSLGLFITYQKLPTT